MNLKEEVKKELKKSKIEIKFFKKEKDFLDFLKNIDFQKTLLISDQGFAGKYLEKKGFKDFFKIKREDLKNVNLAKRKVKNKKLIIGFGGGRSLDIAKKTAADLSLSLWSIPTAPSHEGILSPTASLYQRNKKKSFLCFYPQKVVVPLFLWEEAKRHQIAGSFDILGNFISLEDVFLANKIRGERIKKKELNLVLNSLALILKFLKSKKLEDLASALFLSGLAMKESSRYCSGSEHEIEKMLAPHFSEFLHGELVAVGVLICAKVYQKYQKEFPKDLIFNPKNIYPKILKILKQKNLLGMVKKIFENKKFQKISPEVLKATSQLRSERYTLWNFLDSQKVDFQKLIKEIQKDFQR